MAGTRPELVAFRVRRKAWYRVEDRAAVMTAPRYVHDHRAPAPPSPWARAFKAREERHASEAHRCR